MAGNNRPPYRPPCAGWEYAWNGKAYQHARRTENNIPQWQNNNCNDSIHPTLHYPQADDAWLEANGDGTCSPAATLCGTPGQPLCGPFAYDGRLATDYEQLETTANYGVCKNIGHKTVQAHKSWHGTKPFDENPTKKYRTLNSTALLSGDAVRKTSCGDINWSDWAQYQLQTTVGKDTGIIELVANSYTKSRENATIGACTATMPFYASAQNTILGFTGGVPTLSLMLPSPHGTLDTTPGSPTEGKYVITYADIGWRNVFDPSGGGSFVSWTGTIDEIIYEMENTVIVGGSSGGWTWPPAGTGRCYTPTGSINDSTLYFSYNMFFSQSADTSDEFSIDADYSVTIELSDAYELSDVIGDCSALINQWNPTDNVEYPWRNDEYLTIAPLVSRNEVRSYADSTGYVYFPVEPVYVPQGWIDIGNWSPGEYPDYTNPTGSFPYTSWNNRPDAVDPNSLLFSWDSSTYTTATGNGYTGSQDAWNNLSDADKAYYCPATSLTYTRFDGSILGAPSGKPGAQFFDYEHETWNGVLNCVSTADPNFADLTPYIHSIGARSAHANDGDETDTLLPEQVTQWTNNRLACLLPAGAFIKASTDEVFMQACVFTTIPVKSQNYFGPSGIDRWRPDETKVACAMSDDDTSIVVHSDASSFIPSGTVCVVSTGGTNNGIFTLTTSDGFTYTRSGAKIADIPSGIIWQNDAGLEDNFIAAVRFPNAYGIGGRTKVLTATQDGGNVHITTEDVCYLIAGDKVDFTSVGSLGTNVTISSIESSTSFTVAGTVGAYTSGGYVASHGAPDYKWYDDSFKGEYVKHQWIMTAAGAIDSSSCDTECLPFQPRCVGVTGFWPALTHEFKNANITNFPDVADLNFDGTTNYLWQGGVSLAMNNLYWQQPHTPKGSLCDETATMVDDDGLCQEDTATVDPDTGDFIYTLYYPSAPRVEARCDLPEIDGVTAPALSGTATFPAVSPPEAVNAYVPQEAIDANSYNDVIVPAKSLTEHGLYLAAYECVCGETPGRYATEYANDGIKCC